MSDSTETANGATQQPPAAPSVRRRGRRPADAAARREAVERALADLASARVPFSMADLAERAGISRATLYRDAGLRDLVGDVGDGPANRPINSRDYEKIEARAAELTAERKALRKRIRELEKHVREAQDRIERLEDDNAAYSRSKRAESTMGPGADEKIRTDAFADGFAAGARAYQQRGGPGNRSGGGADLLSVAARLPRQSILAARKTLARALHPDLYASDPATALLATELLKQINELVAAPRQH